MPLRTLIGLLNATGGDGIKFLVGHLFEALNTSAGTTVVQLR